MPNAMPTTAPPPVVATVTLPLPDLIALSRRVEKLRDTSILGSETWQMWDRILSALLEAAEAHS